MSRSQRLVNLAIAAVIAVVAVVVIAATSGGSDADKEAAAAPTPPPEAATSPSASATKEPEAEPRPKPPPAIEVKDGEVVGGVAKLRVSEGERVRFSVTADVADEVHVHAYDFHKDIEPGRTVRFNFPATITGITEIELEAAGLQIASLRVDP